MAPCGIGLGHITRCEPIACRLAENGADLVFSTYLDAVGYARKMGFRTVSSIPIGFRVKQDGTVDFKQTAASKPGPFIGLYRFIRQVAGEIRNLKAYRPDVVFSDSRASSIIAAKMLGIPSVVMLNQFKVNIVREPTEGKHSILDQLFFLTANIMWVFIRTLIGGVWALSRHILIPDLPSPYTISLSNLAIPRRYRSKVRLIGPLISTGPEELDDKGEVKRKLGFNPAKPLVYAAVSGPEVERRHLAGRLIEALSSFSEPYQTVLSRGEVNMAGSSDRRGRLQVYSWIENQFQYLKACDLIVARAGHGIIVKALAYGKPMILIPIPDHTEQYGNARRTAQLKVAVVIPQEELNRNTLLDAVEKMLSSKIYSEKALEVSRAISGLKAVETAAGIVMDIAGQG